MASRTISSKAGPITSEVAGSLLDSKEMPTLPPGIEKDVRKEAKELLKLNPHLWSPDQVEPVLRLVRMRLRLKDLESIVRAEGPILYKENGQAYENPASSASRSTISLIVRMEGQLGILFSSRGSQVKDAEQKAPPRPRGRPRRDDNVARLRLA